MWWPTRAARASSDTRAAVGAGDLAKVRANAIVINGAAVWLRARTELPPLWKLAPQLLRNIQRWGCRRSGCQRIQNWKAAIKALSRREDGGRSGSQPLPIDLRALPKSCARTPMVGPQLVPACSDQPMALSARASCAVGAAAKALGMKAPMQRAARRNRSRRSRMWCLGLRFDAQ